MVEDSKVHQVEIFGQSYNVRGEGDTDYITEVAAYVDKVMRDVSNSTGIADTFKVAILAALNIADDYLALKNKASSEKGEDTEKAISSLVDRIDRCLAEEKGR
ncbi:MAG: cell division protein ZapA [Acidobacteriota bacterium]